MMVTGQEHLDIIASLEIEVRAAKKQAKKLRHKIARLQARTDEARVALAWSGDIPDFAFDHEALRNAVSSVCYLSYQSATSRISEAQITRWLEAVNPALEWMPVFFLDRFDKVPAVQIAGPAYLLPSDVPALAAAVRLVTSAIAGPDNLWRLAVTTSQGEYTTLTTSSPGPGDPLWDLNTMRGRSVVSGTLESMLTFVVTQDESKWSD